MIKEIICEQCKGNGCSECNDNGFIVKEIIENLPKQTRKTKLATKLKIRTTHIRREIGFVKNGKPVSQYDLEGNLLTTWRNSNEVAKCLSLPKVNQFGRKFYRQVISRCARGERKTAYGFIWKYV